MKNNSSNIGAKFIVDIWPHFDLALSELISIGGSTVNMDQLKRAMLEVCSEAVQIEQWNSDLKETIKDYKEAYIILKDASKMKSEVIQELMNARDTSKITN